jgi:hypothetical protein
MMGIWEMRAGTVGRETELLGMSLSLEESECCFIPLIFLSLQSLIYKMGFIKIKIASDMANVCKTLTLMDVLYIQLIPPVQHLGIQPNADWKYQGWGLCL